MSADGDYDQEGWDMDSDEADAAANAGDDDTDVAVQNNFYEAKAIYKDKPMEALEKFETVVMLANPNIDLKDYEFWATKYQVIINMFLGDFDKMGVATKNLLKLSSKVAKNETSEAMNEILDAIQTHLQTKPAQQDEMYNLILGKLKISNERLWFDIILRLGKMLLEQDTVGGAALQRLDTIIMDLKQACRKSGYGHSDDTPEAFEKDKGNLLLEVFALHIQMLTKRKESKKVRTVYNLSLQFVSVIEDARVTGIIQESGGKMYMSEKRWNLALNAFYESFKALVANGDANTVKMLKYVIFSALLAESEIDHLSTQEAKVFVDDPQIQEMAKLREGCHKSDINMINQVFNDANLNLMGDPLFRSYKDDLLRTYQLTALVNLCKPYKTVGLQYLAQKLCVNMEEIRSLLSELILEQRIVAQIDSVTGIVELSAAEQEAAVKHRAVEQWGNILMDIHGKLRKNLKSSEKRSESSMMFCGMRPGFLH